MQFVYPAAVTLDEADGGFVVTFRDWPGAITQGDTGEAALSEAAECLEEAVAARIDDGGEIPMPSRATDGEYGVSVPIQTALKAALYLAVREAGVSKTELARQLALTKRKPGACSIRVMPARRKLWSGRCYPLWVGAWLWSCETRLDPIAA